MNKVPSSQGSSDQMIRRLARREAGAAARIALDELNPKSLPIDPRNLAALWNIPVTIKKITDAGAIGYLEYLGDNRFEIVISDAIDKEGCINFTIAHELGHCCIEGHVEYLFNNGRTRHLTGIEIDNSDTREAQANQFASELIMPDRFCKAAVVNWDADNPGLSTIKKLKSACHSSLHAAANRYVGLTDLPVAVILSNAGRVDYCLVSNELRDHLGKNYSHPKRGSAIPRNLLTTKFANDVSAISRADEPEPLAIYWQDWLGVGRDPALEECVGLGRMGKVLTVLTPNE